MATFKAVVFKNKKRQDGKYHVYIRVTWKRESALIGTEYYVTDKQVGRKKVITRTGRKKEILELKDVFVINEVNRRIAKYENLKSQKLGFRIEMYSARELADYFLKETKAGTDTTINFIEFARNYIETVRSQGRTTTASNLTRTVNAMVDFCNGRSRISINEISAKFLEQFEVYLRKKRVIKRKNQFGRLVTTEKKGLSDISVFDYMTDVRVLFNAALGEYNDEDKDEIRIAHYPFRKYKIKPRPENEKRNLTGEQILSIANVPDEKLQLDRSILARDVFMLSFYLVGMNFADLYEVTSLYKGRVSYERKKTKGRRQDRAFISIRIEPEAEQLVEKYRDKTGERVFDFYKRYTNSHIFTSNVNKGLKKVATACEIKEPLSTYYARHSWATIARNKCGISKDDIDLALNHVDNSKKITDVYIEKDWSMIDDANRKVLDHINNLEKLA